jgi:hypothetical protein
VLQLDCKVLIEFISGARVYPSDEAKYFLYQIRCQLNGPLLDTVDLAIATSRNFDETVIERLDDAEKSPM